MTSIFSFLFSNFHYSKLKFFLVFSKDITRDGNGAGRGRRMGSSSPPRMVLSCPISAPLRMTRKTFSSHPCPLGPREALPHFIKLYFLLIFITIITIFLTKPISLIKIYLKLQLNLSHQIKSIFIKILKNISKCLTRQSQNIYIYISLSLIV